MGCSERECFAKHSKAAFPIILGGDIAGIVEKVGSKIAQFKAGDPIFAYVSLEITAVMRNTR
jgi:NADPH:quinone reductase-like Zn-dependent oxidoreductase